MTLCTTLSSCEVCRLLLPICQSSSFVASLCNISYSYLGGHCGCQLSSSFFAQQAFQVPLWLCRCLEIYFSTFMGKKGGSNSYDAFISNIMYATSFTTNYHLAFRWVSLVGILITIDFSLLRYFSHEANVACVLLFVFFMWFILSGSLAIAPFFVFNWVM